jgi:TatD DNase family protein
MPLVDTHCHIDLEVFEEDRAAVLQHMLAAGVHAAILIAYNPERWLTAAHLAADNPFVRRAIGLHPNDAQMWSNDLHLALRAELARGDALAIGETGLDFYREHATSEQQHAAFVAQMELASEFDLPIIIHQRSAEQEVLDVLRAWAPVRGVMHCFSGDSAFAEACLDVGLHLGVGGVTTYPRSESIRVALRSVPRERIILETDAPFLAPQSSRGKRNEPAFIADVATFLSHDWGIAVEEIARYTTENAIALFGPRLEAAVQAGSERAACV